MHRNGSHLARAALTLFALPCLLATAPRAVAADHDDTDVLKSIGRHDARLTDLHVFTREAPRGRAGKTRTDLLIGVSTNPTIPTSLASYTFPSDLEITISVDRHSAVDFDDEAGAPFGGTVLNPAGIAADVQFRVTFDPDSGPRLESPGLDRGTEVRFFVGLRDDPFIRGPRAGRNVASIVLEMPLAAVAGGRPHGTLLVWASSSVPGPSGPTGDMAGRALRSQFAENMALNDYTEPAEQAAALHVRPDVVIFDTTRPAAYPNGRDLTDDVVDLVGDPRILNTDCPSPGNPAACNPSENDVPFLPNFPYLAPPH